MALVNTMDVEMPESFYVRLLLDDTYGGHVRLSENEDEVELQFEIFDDDGTADNCCYVIFMCYFVFQRLSLV